MVRLPVVLTIFTAVLAQACSSNVPARDPVGEPFPVVRGRSLDGRDVELPTEFDGAPVILIVGYRQKAQFDIDRWLMGLLQAEVAASIVEVPTIRGLVPTMISGWIDDGMRSGIPPEDWAAVVTLYGAAAAPVVELTGNEEGQRARVLLLDGEGRVRCFADEGYSARVALELAEAARTVRTSP